MLAVFSALLAHVVTRAATLPNLPRIDLTIWPDLYLTSCEPVTWKWEGGTPPYNLCASSLLSPAPPTRLMSCTADHRTITTAQSAQSSRYFLLNSSCTSYTWIIDMPAGYHFNWMLTDVNSDVVGGSSWSNGDKWVTVVGGSTDCIGASCEEGGEGGKDGNGGNGENDENSGNNDDCKKSEGGKKSKKG